MSGTGCAWTAASRRAPARTSGPGCRQSGPGGPQSGPGQRNGTGPGPGEPGGAGCAQKVTAISVFRDGSAVPSGSVGAGQIGQLWGLAEARIGDTFGLPPAGRARHQFTPPTLETVVVPRCPRAKGALHAALAQLAEQDPLINLRLADVQQGMLVSLYGEVQKEVIQATLAGDFGIEVEFRGTTTLCIEQPAGTGAAVEIIGTAPNPFLATVGLRVGPAPAGSGVRFELEIEPGSLPLAFRTAIEETVHATLRQGLHGWQVTDCLVTLTRFGLLAAAEPRPWHVRQEHVEHGAGLP